MADFYMLVGLMGSGKSTLAEKLFYEISESMIISSDETRKYLFGDVSFQGDNAKVFEEMKIQTEKALKDGINVIYDATNLSRKKRMALIKNLKFADKKIVFYVATSFKRCVENDLDRTRNVEYYVIARAYKQLQIPIKSEGWDEIHTIYNKKDFELTDMRAEIHYNALMSIVNNKDVTCESFELELSSISEDFSNIRGLSQDSKYHHFSVSRHTYYVFKYIKELAMDKKRKEDLLIASIFHDTGKYFCKSFINHKGAPTRYASFIGHELVSSQIADLTLYELGFDRDRINNITTLIQFHMDLNQEGDKVMSRLEKLLTPEQIEDLLILHEADLSAK